MEEIHKPKVSVIVPIYKVEKYIEKCAVHLLEQTIDSIEIIFIDDCGLDNSMQVLEETLKRYPKRRDSVRIYRNVHNVGLIANRRKGIEMATGEFITHCDSDDWVDKNLYESLYNKAIETDSDVAVCPFRWENSDSIEDIELPKLPTTCKELVRDWYKYCIGMNHCNKIIKRSILIEHQLSPCDDTGAWEDASMMFRAFYFAGGLTQIDNAVYHYNRTNIAAITAQVNRKSIEQLLNCARILEVFFLTKKDAADFVKTSNAIKFIAKLDLVNTRFDWLREFNTLFPESNSIVKELPRTAFSKKGYFRFQFVKHHLAWLFVLMFKVYTKIS